MTQPISHTIRNFNPFSTYREVKKDGREYLVVNGVAIVEGVLNKYFVPFEEFGAFEKDWDGVPLVLRHPKQNNGSARVPHPDVPVIGNFYSASLDSTNRRMTGEYWFDKATLLAFDEGKKIHNDILAGKMIETSTGYYAGLEQNPGDFKGITFIGIQRNIHPDHIAVLPDEVGACSIKDGCGINRNSSVVSNCDGCPCKNGAVQNMTGNMPAEGKAMYERVYKEAREAGDSEEVAAKKAWGACKKAGWHKKGDEWVKANYAIYTNEDDGMGAESKSMIAFMLPEDVREQIREKFPFITDEVYNSLHLTLAYLGETPDVDMVRSLWSMFEAADYQTPVQGKVQGLARFISADDDQDAFVLTFDSPDIHQLHRSLTNTLGWRGVRLPSEHGFIPHITLAYIGKDDELPANTFEPFDLAVTGIALVNGDDVMLNVPFTGGGMIALNHGGDRHKNGTDQSVHGGGNGKSSWKEGYSKHGAGFAIIRDSSGLVESATSEPANLRREKDVINWFMEHGLTDDDFSKIEHTYKNGQYILSLRKNTQAPSLFKNMLDKLFRTQNNKENPMDKIKELLRQIANSAGWNVSFDDASKSANVTLNTAAPLSDELTGLESIVKEMGGVEKFKATLNALANIPANMQALTETVNGLGEGLKTASAMAQNAAQEAETKKANVISRLIANAACPLDETTLKGLSVMQLEKLEASIQPTSYLGLGSFVNQTTFNASDDVLGVPSMVLGAKE